MNEIASHMGFFQAIKGKMGIIFLIGLLGGAGAFVILTTQAKSYRAGTDFLIIQNQASTQDYYTLSRSAEYVSKILNEAIYSETFVDEAMKDGQIGNDLLPISKKDRMKEWSSVVRASRNTDLGIIHVDTFANSQRDAIKLSLAISKVLSEKSSLFLGEGQSISIRLISGPLADQNPSLQTLIGAVAGGLLLGIFLSSMFVYYQTLPIEAATEYPIETERTEFTGRIIAQRETKQAERPMASQRGGAPANLPFAQEDPELARLRHKIMDEEAE